MIYNDLFISSKLPDNLSEDVLNDYFSKMKDDKDIRDIVISSNIRFVIKFVIDKFSSSNYELSDLIAIGCYELIKSVDTFDPTKKVKFLTYASSVIYNEILMFMRREKKHDVVDSYDRNFSSNDGEDVTLKDIIMSIEDCFVDEYENKELITEILNFIDTLPTKEQEVMKYSFGIGTKRLTQEQIADCMNFNQSYISRIKKRALLKLRKYLVDKNFIELSKKLYK